MKKPEAQQRALRDLFSQKGEAGFTLIELLVVVIIAGVLAAIGIPAWQGMRLKTQAAGAKTVIANIKKECQSNRALDVEEVFTPITPNGYSVQPQGSLSCYGDPGTGLVSAVPNEVDKNPTYFYEHLTGLLSEESGEATNLPPNESIAFGPDNANNSKKSIDKLTYPDDIPGTHCVMGGLPGNFCSEDGFLASELYYKEACRVGFHACQRAEESFGCEWDSINDNFKLSSKGETCAERINDWDCAQDWEALNGPGATGSSFRRCGDDEYVDPRWEASLKE